MNSRTTSSQVKKQIFSFENGTIETCFETFEEGYITKQSIKYSKEDQSLTPRHLEQKKEAIENMLLAEKEVISSVREQNQTSNEYAREREKNKGFCFQHDFFLGKQKEPAKDKEKENNLSIGSAMRKYHKQSQTSVTEINEKETSIQNISKKPSCGEIQDSDSHKAIVSKQNTVFLTTSQ